MQGNRGKSRILHRKGKRRFKEGKSLPRIPLLIGVRAGIYTEIFQAKTKSLSTDV